MKPTKNGKQTPESGFLLAAYDMLGDISVEHSVHVGYQFTPTVRRGVYKVRLSALRATNGDKMVRAASYETEFPTSVAQDLGAALFQAAIHLERLLDSQRAVNRAQGAPE